VLIAYYLNGYLNDNLVEEGLNVSAACSELYIYFSRN